MAGAAAAADLGGCVASGGDCTASGGVCAAAAEAERRFRAFATGATSDEPAREAYAACGAQGTLSELTFEAKLCKPTRCVGAVGCSRGDGMDGMKEGVEGGRRDGATAEGLGKEFVGAWMERGGGVICHPPMGVAH